MINRPPHHLTFHRPNFQWYYVEKDTTKLHCYQTEWTSLSQKVCIHCLGWASYFFRALNRTIFNHWTARQVSISAALLNINGLFSVLELNENPVGSGYFKKIISSDTMLQSSALRRLPVSIIVLLVSTCVQGQLFNHNAQYHKRVLLSEVKSLTLRKGQVCTFRATCIVFQFTTSCACDSCAYDGS